MRIDMRLHIAKDNHGRIGYELLLLRHDINLAEIIPWFNAKYRCVIDYASSLLHRLVLLPLQAWLRLNLRLAQISPQSGMNVAVGALILQFEALCENVALKLAFLGQLWVSDLVKAHLVAIGLVLIHLVEGRLRLIIVLVAFLKHQVQHVGLGPCVVITYSVHDSVGGLLAPRHMDRQGLL